MNRLQYHKRLIESRLESALKTFPVCVLTGARQTGKSTLVRSFPGAEYPKTSLPGLLIHAGRDMRWISDDALAVPWWKLM